MAKKGVSRTRAIQNALARLGMHASPKQVVAFLANVGIDVNDGLVRQVKIDMLKQAAKSERQRVRTTQIGQPQVRCPAPMIPLFPDALEFPICSYVIDKAHKMCG